MCVVHALLGCTARTTLVSVAYQRASHALLEPFLKYHRPRTAARSARRACSLSLETSLVLNVLPARTAHSTGAPQRVCRAKVRNPCGTWKGHGLSQRVMDQQFARGPGGSTSLAGQYYCSATCSPGQFSGTGDSACHSCPVDTYTDSWGQSACLPCQGTSLAVDEECVPELVAPIPASLARTMLPAGSHSAAGSTGCSSCPDPGTYYTSSGCYRCPRGQFSVGYQVACTPCPLGQSTSTDGASACTPCSVGTAGTGYYCYQCSGGYIANITGLKFFRQRSSFEGVGEEGCMPEPLLRVLLWCCHRLVVVFSLPCWHF